METDLLIIGGGITGCGIAADAAGRGLSVTLCEKDDLAFATSSATTKLIHGGLRYLETYQFKMVRESLKESEILLKKAPHIITPMAFVLPHSKNFRSTFTIRLGLKIYELLYPRRTIPKSKYLNLQKVSEGNPIKGQYKVGFKYYDFWADDARLVVLNALAARERGAKILTRTACQFAKRKNDYWLVTLHDRLRDKIITLKAKAIVNATGPWVSEVIKDLSYIPSVKNVRLIQGSHIVVDKLYEGRHAYVLQNPDGRIVFAIPYENKFTLIGTTDIPYNGDPSLSAPSNKEINYLCNSVNRYFASTLSINEIIWSFSGVRPLYDDLSENPSKITREYYLDYNKPDGKAPVVSIFGGKLTAYRILAEKVLALLKDDFPQMGPAWTADAKLPGGHCDNLSYPDFIKALEKQYNWLPLQILERYGRAYGDLCHAILADCQSLSDLGQHFGAGLYEKEILYLIKNEWAQKIDDLLWRRSKLGLHLDRDKIKAIERYLECCGSSSDDSTT